MLQTLYGPFIDITNWVGALSPSGLTTILSLVVLECLLSVDNAVVLAAQTEQLSHPADRKKALLYGMGGAYLFRVFAIGLGTFLLHFWALKAIGGAYLLWMSGHYFYQRRNSKPATHQTAVPSKGLWHIIGEIEALDVIFSIDSILAALAVSSNPVIVLIGGCLGILAMRLVAQIMTSLLAKIPELQTAAYVLVGVIALKLLLALPQINVIMPDWLFSLVIVVVFITVFWHHKRHLQATYSQK